MISRRLVLCAATLPWAGAHATPVQVAALVDGVTRGAVPQKGLVRLELPELVENGNAVGLTVGLDGAMPAPLEALHVFAAANPNPEVLRVRFGPAAFRRAITTRIRLADSQTVTAIARLQDGTCWIDSVTLIVTQAACLE